MLFSEFFSIFYLFWQNKNIMDKKINIVEGNSEIRERIKLYLESKSYEIFEINYGNEAIFV